MLANLIPPRECHARSFQSRECSVASCRSLASGGGLTEERPRQWSCQRLMNKGKMKVREAREKEKSRRPEAALPAFASRGQRTSCCAVSCETHQPLAAAPTEDAVKETKGKIQFLRGTGPIRGPKCFTSPAAAALVRM